MLESVCLLSGTSCLSSGFTSSCGRPPPRFETSWAFTPRTKRRPALRLHLKTPPPGGSALLKESLSSSLWQVCCSPSSSSLFGRRYAFSQNPVKSNSTFSFLFGSRDKDLRRGAEDRRRVLSKVLVRMNLIADRF